MSDFYTPLYDTERGGPPRAFRCETKNEEPPMSGKFLTCVRVTRTESGMLMHLRLCHGVERQPRLFK